MASPRVRKPEIHEVKTTGSLCDANSGYGALRCNPYGGCPGASSNCAPNVVWSGTPNGSNYNYGNLNRVHLTPPQGTTPILPTLMVCAVSWIWNYKNLKKIFTFLPYIQLFKYYWNWKLTLRVSWLTGFGRMGIQIVSGVILMIQHCSLIQAIIVRQSLCCQTKLPVFILGTAAQWKQNKPCSATLTAAARAQQAVQIGLTTATRTWFGQALQLTAATTCLHCRMVV